MLAMSPGINDRLSAPKGREISAQGFNPGLVDRIRRALKVAPEEASLGHRYADSIGCRKSGASRDALRSRSFNGSTPIVGEGSRPRDPLLAKPSTLSRSWAKIHLLVETRPRGARGRAPSPNCTRERGVGGAFRAHFSFTSNPGLKPWAKLHRPFGAETATPPSNP
jgi:hypothetical protein